MTSGQFPDQVSDRVSDQVSARVSDRLSSRAKVLIVDDDPTHLEIYGLLLQHAGYEPVSALVKFAGAEIPKDDAIGLVLLDYRLQSERTSAEFAQEIRGLLPDAPIVVLSDMWSLPADIAPYVTDFVRKGQPAKLLQVVGKLLPRSRGPANSQASRMDPGAAA
jgi:DNA-binding NtrC family response regulator